MSSQLFKQLEEYQGEKYPKFLVKILISAGFDNKLSLSQIDEDAIKVIEQYVEKNQSLIAKTPYKRKNISEQFSFSIGHKILLKKIPQILKQIKEKKKESRTKISRAGKNVDDKDIERIKIDILARVEKYAIDCNIKFETSDRNIVNFIEIDGIGYKCHITCPICTKSFSCIYKNNRWNISNITNHLRAHRLNGDELTSEQISEHTSADTSVEHTVVSTSDSGNIRIQRFTITSNDLLDILNVSPGSSLYIHLSFSFPNFII